MIASSRLVAAAAILVAGAVAVQADTLLTLKVMAPSPVTVELFRWSTDSESATLRAALAPLPPAPPVAAPAAGAARGGRAGGRGRGAAPPASPAARLVTALKASPTVGFIWGDGPTGFSIKHAWRSALPDGRERLVLVTDRRMTVATADAASSPADDAEFTVLELRVDAKGLGEARASHALPAVTNTPPILALGGDAAATGPFKVTR